MLVTEVEKLSALTPDNPMRISSLTHAETEWVKMRKASGNANAAAHDHPVFTALHMDHHTG